MLPTDVRVDGAELYFLPVQARVPLKFGAAVVTSVTCARVRVRVVGQDGSAATGWGETPLSVQWAWPSAVPYEERHAEMKRLCIDLAHAWAGFDAWGHALEVGWRFLEDELPRVMAAANARRAGTEPIPWLAALVCCSAFDIAVHDAYGILWRRDTYTTDGPDMLGSDLADFMEPAEGAGVSFAGRYPADYIVDPRPRSLPVWHLVGGLDPLEPGDPGSEEPGDGYPVLLRDWIRQDGLKCLKVKLRGTDAEWDYARTVAVGRIGRERKVEWLSLDFNCTVTDPTYVTGFLDRLAREHPDLDRMVLYVEQPFPYDLDQHPLDVHAVSARKPLFMDESAHDWRVVRHGRELGWTGVALKTCKTQTGALLSLCWARAHGMALMVQDLTNPMLAMVPHALLAARAGTIMGVEANAAQFWPDASLLESRVHRGLYRRSEGRIELGTVCGPGLGYGDAPDVRPLPPPVVQAGALAGE